LLPWKASDMDPRELTAAHQPTGDYSDICEYLHELGATQPGRPFQFVLADVIEQIYVNTGKWNDPDIEEIYNDEFLDALQDLLKEDTMTDELMQEKTDMLRNVRATLESAANHAYTLVLELEAAERHFAALTADLQKGWDK
jgi:hypothetical protein